MRQFVKAVAFLTATPVMADLPDPQTILDQHVLPGYAALSSTATILATAAAEDCTAENPNLRAAYHDAFDAWIAVSHLRFGPSELDDRAFSLAYWPDTRGATPKALGSLIRNTDPVVNSLDTFSTVSVASRGFYALEFLLYDDTFMAVGDPDYRCALIRMIAADIAANAAAIQADWSGSYGDLVVSVGNDIYRSEAEVARQFFTSLTTGLEFTSDIRLGRPLGTFDRPRPNRAEARRSGRSMRHVILSLNATRELAALMSDDNTAVDDAFEIAIQKAGNLDDPVLAGVMDPVGRFRVEGLQQNIDLIRKILTEEVGPSLGIAAGFNSLDGD